jgi:hypothetical protein
MPSILDLPHPLLCLRFTIADVVANAITDGIPPGAQTGGATGYPVPSGYRFIPVYLQAVINDACTAGSCTVAVTDSGTELTGGPEAVINTTDTLNDSGSVSGDPDSVPAGHLIGISANANSAFLPDGSADIDAFVLGYYKPV